MWKIALNKSVRECRFVLKQGPEHHGAWNFVMNRLPELKMLNKNTFFTLTEINDKFTKTTSACHIIYGDYDNTEAYIESEGLSASEFEELFKQKIAAGANMDRQSHTGYLFTPHDVVEARNSMGKFDDL